jgi:hypothetical protein
MENDYIPSCAIGKHCLISLADTTSGAQTGPHPLSHMGMEVGHLLWPSSVIKSVVMGGEWNRSCPKVFLAVNGLKPRQAACRTSEVQSVSDVNGPKRQMQGTSAISVISAPVHRAKGAEESRVRRPCEPSQIEAALTPSGQYWTEGVSLLLTS